MKTSTINKIKIMIFGVGLAGIFLICILHKPTDFSERENRYLSQMPKLSFAKISDGSFMKEYESAITDQIPCRDAFTAVKTFVEKNRGMQDENGVYFGNDGYLLGKYDESVFTSELAKKNIAFLTEFAKNTKKEFAPRHFQMIMVPSSAEILPDKLPEHVHVFNQTQWINDIKKGIGSEYFINAAEVLAPHDDQYIYYRTDHHYTTLGAWYVYKSWREKTGMSVLPLNSYEKKKVAGFFGTYDSKVNTALSGGVISDYISLYSLPESDSSTMTWDGKDDKVYEGIFDRKKLKTKDKYSVFFGGNHGITDISTGVPDKGTLLVIKDSFAHSLVPFAMQDYSRIVMVDLRYFNQSLKKYIHSDNISDILLLYSTADFAEDGNMAKLKS